MQKAFKRIHSHKVYLTYPIYHENMDELKLLSLLKDVCLLNFNLTILKYAISKEAYSNPDKEKKTTKFHFHVLLIFDSQIDTRNPRCFDFTFNEQIYHGHYLRADSIENVFMYLHKNKLKIFTNFSDIDIWFKDIDAIKQQHSLAKSDSLKNELFQKEQNINKKFAKKFLSPGSHICETDKHVDSSIGLIKDQNFWQTVCNFQKNLDFKGLSDFLYTHSPKTLAKDFAQLKKSAEALKENEEFIDLEDLKVHEVVNIPIKLKIYAGLSGFKHKTLFLFGPSGLGKTISAKLLCIFGFNKTRVVISHRNDFFKNRDLKSLHGVIIDDNAEIFEGNYEYVISLVSLDNNSTQIGARYNDLVLPNKNFIRIFTTNRTDYELHEYKKAISRRIFSVHFSSSIFSKDNKLNLFSLTLDDYFEIFKLLEDFKLKKETIDKVVLFQKSNPFFLEKQIWEQLFAILDSNKSIFQDYENQVDKRDREKPISDFRIGRVTDTRKTSSFLDTTKLKHFYQNLKNFVNTFNEKLKSENISPQFLPSPDFPNFDLEQEHFLSETEKFVKKKPDLVIELRPFDDIH